MKQFNERTHLIQFIERAMRRQGGRALDVGCGRGENLQLMRRLGHNVVGVDVNPAHVTAAHEQGFEAYTSEEFAAVRDQFDLVLMSHVIEHFDPQSLLGFIDCYADRLCGGGHLIIVTPTLWRRFYCEFDHVRPYTPHGIEAVFSEPESQVQFHSRNHLTLVDLALRKKPRRVPDPVMRTAMRFNRYRAYKLPYRLQTLGFRFLYALTAGCWGGEITGWVGLFQKHKQDDSGHNASASGASAS